MAGEGDCTVVVVGAGAAGALTATHLVTGLSQRFRVVLVDPAGTTGRGAAYSTTDERHLLNVPAAGMTAFPRDPEHFFRWVRRHHDPEVQPSDFVPRHVFGSYVESLLESASQYPGNARLERRRSSVTSIEERHGSFVVTTVSTDESARGEERIPARSVILATGSPASTSWAPESLVASPRFVSDPWRQDLPEGDLLLVGTGLSTVDVAIAGDRPGRTLHTLSRHDLLPRVHRSPATPAVPPPPGITRVTDVEQLRSVIEEHLARTARETGDWRAAIDGLRPVTAQLWAGLGDDSRRAFLAEHAREWDVHRHRMPQVTADRLQAIADAGRLERHQGTVLDVRSTPHGLEVTVSDGATLEVLHVAAIVNCTGPDSALASSPLLAQMARVGLVRPGPAGIGIATADDGRVLGVGTHSLPFFALGALRRGSLWETTAMPEIREQAYAVAQSVVRSMNGESRRRPVDRYGIALTTSDEAALAYDDALGTLLRLQDGVEEGLRRAVELDPDFVQAHAALALLGHEWGAVGAWRSSLATAHEAAGSRHLDDREISFLDAVTTRLRSDEETGAAALLRHVRLFPRDALAVSVTVPTVAFGGLTSGRQTAELVEGLGRSYGDDWWYAGQLAFVRQDQERWAEAEDLASYALSVEPASGHAVHARAHVFYETGRHAEGLAWLDEWIRTCGRQANHRSHFSWHAALHELVQCDVDAVRRRYARELAPTLVTGSRALVDSGALIWRCRMAGAPLETLDSPTILASAPEGWLLSPPTAFVAMHVALSLAAADDPVGLAGLRTTSLAHADPVFREVVAPVCAALQALLERRPERTAAELERVLPRVPALGGSAAQRDVLEDTFVHALAESGQGERAAEVLDLRLARRESPLDARRRTSLRKAAPRRPTAHA